MKAYQIHISLNYVEPPVWRRAVIPGELTFSRLASMLNDIMGWMGGHLFAVTTADGEYITGFPECEGLDKALGLDRAFGNEMSGGSKDADAMLSRSKTFVYTYDLGDSWDHTVKIEAIQEESSCFYPQILDGEGDCPPDDAGGPMLYMELLEHPENFDEEFSDFVFDEIEAFDKEETNDYLRDIYGGRSPEFRRLWQPEQMDPVSYGGPETFPSLEEALDCYRVEDLKCICRELNLRGYSGRKKQQIVSMIAEGLEQNDVFSKAFEDLSDDEVEFFENLCDTPWSFLSLSEEAVRIAEEFLCRGLVFQTIAGIYFVPQEIQSLYGKVDKEALTKKRRRIQLILDYCKAAVNLYGIVEIKHVCRMFSQQNEEKLSQKVLSPILEQFFQRAGCSVGQRGEYLHTREIDWEIFDLILQQQEGKPYYVPPKEEFLKYADVHYCEHNLAWEGLEHFFLHELDLEPFKAELLCHELHMLVHVGASMDMLMELLDDFDVKEPNERQMMRMSEMFMDAWNCSRMVLNRGFTPNEMHSSSKVQTEQGGIPDNVIPFPAGRN